MRAAIYEKPGAAQAVLRVLDLPEPEAGPGEVRVKLQWSGINPSDAKARAGLRAPMHPGPFTVPHSDGMGRIDRVGPGVDPQRIGQRVWIWNGAYGRQFGTAAELIALPQQQAVPLPDQVEGRHAACFGVPALTAMHAVLAAGGVRGKTVLVAGGAGAVGNYAVQFARLLGARLVVATVSSEEKAAWARAGGADVVLNYRSDDIVARVMDLTDDTGMDRIIDVDVAGNAATHAEITAAEGEWMVYGSGKREFSLEFFPLISRNISLHFYVVYRLSKAAREAAIKQLTTLLEQESLVHNVARELALDEIALAHELVEQGRTVGNVVLRI